ncbi:RDD family protein [Microscilla marina]|uniref:hypothetical protein n=1 Tax=Microscilla marina TaxID=1027 RepID=UPI0005D46D42|nr:hypothetical protein [Microscilla marina]
MCRQLTCCAYPTSIPDAFRTVIFWGKQYFSQPLAIIVGGILLLDYCLAFAVPGRQTLHDLLAGTYAITRESFYAEYNNKNPYLMNIIGETVLLKNYRSNSILATSFPQKAVVKAYVKLDNDRLNMFLLELTRQVKLEGRNIMSNHLVIQLQDEHSSLRSGRNQVVYLLAPPANIDFEARYELTENELLFLDFVVVE